MSRQEVPRLPALAAAHRSPSPAPRACWSAMPTAAIRCRMSRFWLSSAPGAASSSIGQSAAMSRITTSTRRSGCRYPGSTRSPGSSRPRSASRASIAWGYSLRCPPPSPVPRPTSCTSRSSSATLRPRLSCSCWRSATASTWRAWCAWYAACPTYCVSSAPSPARVARRIPAALARCAIRPPQQAEQPEEAPRHDTTDYPHRSRPKGDWPLFPGRESWQHRLSLRADRSGSADWPAGKRYHRCGDSPGAAEPRGRGQRSRRLARSGRQTHGVSDRSESLPAHQRDHAAVLSRTLSRARRHRCGRPAARCARRDGVRTEPRVSRASRARPASAAAKRFTERVPAAARTPASAAASSAASPTAASTTPRAPSPAEALFILPLRYEDRTHVVPIGALQTGMRAVVEGEILLNQIVYRGRRQLLARLADRTGTLTLRFFYFSNAQREGLERGTLLRCHGEVRRGPQGLELVHPEYRRVQSLGEPLEQTLTPIYPASMGLTQGRCRLLIDRALRGLARDGVAELLPEGLRARHGLPALVEALQLVHRPPSGTQLAELAAGRHPAQRRLAFEELLAHHLALLQLRGRSRTERAQPLADAPG